MNLKISAALLAVLLAIVELLTPAQPNSAEAARHNNLGVAYMNQQLFEKALKEFQQALDADPKLAIARLNEGVAYLNMQKVDDAKKALEDALKQDPKSPNVWYSLGLLAKNSGDAPSSIDAFKHVTETDPGDADAWYFLGTAYAQAKQFAPAIDAFEHALKINPLHASAEFGLSRAYQQSGDTEHAREHLKQFQHITQNKLGSPMSLAYGEQGQYSRAVESPQSQLKPPAQIKVQFVDVTKEAGIVGKPDQDPQQFTDAPPMSRLGACFFDYDNDGRIDLFLADNGPLGSIGLYHNLGDGKFEDVTTKSGLDPSLHATSCTTGDIDNDGFADLIIGAGGKVLIEHNQKDGTFKDIASPAGIRGMGVVTSLTLIDYDHDGDLDIFIGSGSPQSGMLWRNNGDGTFTNVSELLPLDHGFPVLGAVGTDYNNDRAVDLVVAGHAPTIFENPREGNFKPQRPWEGGKPTLSFGVALLDFNHDGWMDLAFASSPATLWRNVRGSFESVPLPDTSSMLVTGIAAFDYDNDGWVDLVIVGGTRDQKSKGEIRLFRNLGPDGFKDVTADVGLDKIQLSENAFPAIAVGDYDNDGAVDLLITQNHGPAVLLKNEGGNKNHWLRLALKGLADNKSAIGTKVEVFSGGNRQKFEIYGSNGYLGQNSPYLTVGLGESKDADIVRMLWPTGVLQDEINIAGDKQQDFMEIDRRGSSCPTLFVWNGERYEFVADMLGAGVVGHWIGPNQRDIPRPVEWIKIPTGLAHAKENPHFSQTTREVGHPLTPNAGRRTPVLSFRFMEPLEEAVYLDQVRLLAVDHPADVDVYPNEYFASNPPYPPFKVVVSRDAQPVAGAWDEHGHNLLPDLLAHKFVGDFAMTQFQGFAKTHDITLDLGQPYDGGALWLLMHGEIEYFSANSMYAASQAKLEAIAPYVEALSADGKWKRVIDDMGFPAGGPRTMTADLTDKLPQGTQQIRITTNLQIYWDSIMVDRTEQVAPASGRLSRGRPAVAGTSDAASVGLNKAGETPAGQPGGRRRYDYRLTPVPLAHADLAFHGYPYKIEGLPPGNVKYVYEKASATGPYTRPMGTYTRYGDVLPLLTKTDDKLAVFGSGDEVRLDFDPSKLPALPQGWVRDYFFAANGYEKDMDFYAAEGNFVAPLPFLSMGEYPYSPKKSFPLDAAHVNYLLEYNTRHMSGNEQRGYWFDYGQGSRK
ncbi:MAG TPA: FG-GAP-like repeat-containing protein [Candidatus Sulfotelmatobacter sp.]|nr:FG-GAP-like repeat-containing protein [Candidatus Sulfotelmatobacter sp.]